jgi:hypothetical protein
MSERVTQVAVETISVGVAERISQVAVETVAVTGYDYQRLRVSQVVCEIVVIPDAHLRRTQVI